jgi:ribosomal protein S18 acetylase RimI-like enzyme
MTSDHPAVRVGSYDGPRAALRPLFEEAEDSAAQLESYLDHGHVLVARIGGDLVGHLQLVQTGRDGEVELKSMAVDEERRGSGIGTMLVDEALARSRADGRTRMVVATAAADIGNLRFYQRRGFRLERVERDAFDAAAGYDDVVIEGIPLRDRVWFSQEL